MTQERGLPKFAYSSPLRIPEELDYLVETVQASRKLFELSADFDGEGSMPPAEATVVRANDFLLQNAIVLFEQEGKTMPAPEISVAGEESVDMHWRNGEQELLVNIPADRSEPVTFYGDENSAVKVKGETAVDEQRPEIFNWLK